MRNGVVGSAGAVDCEGGATMRVCMASAPREVPALSVRSKVDVSETLVVLAV